jgi:MFS family permease
MVLTPAAGPPPTPRRYLPVLAWALWTLTILGFAAFAVFDLLLRRVGRPDLSLLTSSDTVPYLLGMMSAATVGLVLAIRRPRHPVGWLLLALGTSIGASALATSYARYGLLARPGSLPGAGYAAVWFEVGVFVWADWLGFILLLTPTGSLPSPRWRWWARTVVAAAVLGVASSALLPLEPPFQSAPNPLAVPALAGPLQAVNGLTLLVTGLSVLVAAGSLVVRFRRARGVERQQLRWLALAAALTAMVVLVLVALIPSDNELLLGWLSAVCIALLPLATGAAILRYRLYDLDRIISRTLAYGLLTVLLGGGYALAVLGLGQLLGQGSSLAVAGATLAVAVAFQPVRRRVQAAVDRRFNRRRYDAAQTIQAFSARLRDEVDLDTLTGELLAVVEQTMQPTQTWLWLRPRPTGVSPERDSVRVGL